MTAIAKIDELSIAGRMTKPSEGDASRLAAERWEKTEHPFGCFFHRTPAGGGHCPPFSRSSHPVLNPSYACTLRLAYSPIV